MIIAASWPGRAMFAWQWTPVALLVVMSFTPLVARADQPSVPGAASPALSAPAATGVATAASPSVATTAASWDVSPRASFQERGVPLSAKILRYSQRLVAQYDANHNGQLEKDEWSKMQGNPTVIDRDRDGVITVEDLARYITIYGRYRHIHLLAPALGNTGGSAAGENGAAAGEDNSDDDAAPSGGQPGESNRSDDPEAGMPGQRETLGAASRAEGVSAPPPATSQATAGQAPSVQTPAAQGRGNAEPAAAAAPAGSDLLTASGALPFTPAPQMLQVVPRSAVPAHRFFVPGKRLSSSLPAWFVARDLDGDGQLTLSEFAPNATKEDIREFNRYDADHDGVITAKEVMEYEGRRGGEAAVGTGQEAGAREQGSGIRQQRPEAGGQEPGTRGRRSRPRD